MIRHIEVREQWQREDVWSPELQRHAAPVDLICTIGSRLYAIEHTGVEPFHGHIKMEVDGPPLFGPIADRLAGALPRTEDFELHVPVGATVGLMSGDLARIQDALVSWILEMAPTLAIAPPGRYLTPIKKVKLPGVPFLVALHRCATGGRPGRFSILHLVNNNVEASRASRIREACERKFPKLAAWKRSHGARTILVLEENDIQLTNPQRVADAVLRVEGEMGDKPDEIYLVTTCVGDLWWVTCIRRDDRSYYAFDDPAERISEIDPATLVPVTGR